MAVVVSNMSGHIQKQLTRSLERILEEAYLSGELKLSGRKLKDFPKIAKTGSKYNLCDTVIADLSKNRFGELPEEVTEFAFLEKLYLYHNAIRVIPETVVMLQSLSYLDLSRNQLTSLPREVCRLPLQILLVAYNRLASLPDELGRMTVLAELDVGCNEITSLSPRIGDLPRLKSLDLRSNLLVHLPIELTYLKLVKLDISGNCISVLPNELRKMKSLIEFKLSENPLTSPPASLCTRGRIHIFKYLERQAVKHERTRTGRLRRSPMDSRGHATLDVRSHRRHNVDSGYNTSDGIDKRWSQEIHSGTHENELRGGWRSECSPLSITLPNEVCLNGSFSGTSTPSTISPGENTTLEDEMGTTLNRQESQLRRLERSASESGADSKKPMSPAFHNNSITPPGHTESNLSIDHSSSAAMSQRAVRSGTSGYQINGEEKKPFNHTQTYKEYKEALRQQRINESLSIYRPREQTAPSSNVFPSNDTNIGNGKNSTLTGNQILNDDSESKISIQNVSPLRLNHQNMPIINGSNSEHNGKNIKYSEQPPYKKPSSPATVSGSFFCTNSSPGHMPRLVKTTATYSEDAKNQNQNSASPKSPKSTAWNSHNAEKYSFTMRREFERAKEEADLIEQLRNNIETRLKMALPVDLAPALIDGVVLCHLANHVRPRSVGSIHVPSPAVPKLTMARCRRNVDNFLEACRKIGVDEEVLMDADAIMDVGYMNAYGLLALTRIVSALLLHREDEAHGERITDSNCTNKDRVLSIVLFFAFLFSLALLYLFPVPS